MKSKAYEIYGVIVEVSDLYSRWFSIGDIVQLRKRSDGKMSWVDTGGFGLTALIGPVRTIVVKCNFSDDELEFFKMMYPEIDLERICPNKEL